MNYESENINEKNIAEENVQPVSEEKEMISKEVEHKTIEDFSEEIDRALSSEETDAQTEEPVDAKPKKGWKRELIEWIESLGVAVVIALLITNFVFTMVLVDGSSMEPTLHNKNQLFVLRLGYEPKNGDIIVFKPRGEENKRYIKRVIAVEGQTVDIKNGYVYVDGERLEEEYVSARIANEYPGRYPKTVPANCVFVLGDNRNASRDSRDEATVGMVDESSIVGKAWFRLLPLSQFGGLYNNYNLK